MAQFTIRIPDEMHEQIKAAAEEDKRSMNGTVEWLLEAGLEWRLHAHSRLRAARERYGNAAGDGKAR